MNANLQIKTVNVCVFSGESYDTKILLLKKARGSQKGLWQIVSGKPEDGESFWQGALRELKEETGLTPKRFFEVGAEAYYNYKLDAVCLNPTFAAEVAAGSEVTLSDEHDEYEWLPYEEAALRLAFPSQRETVTRVCFVIASPSAPLAMEIPPQIWTAR